jgi:hypothetical protein
MLLFVHMFFLYMSHSSLQQTVLLAYWVIYMLHASGVKLYGIRNCGGKSKPCHLDGTLLFRRGNERQRCSQS